MLELTIQHEGRVYGEMTPEDLAKRGVPQSVIHAATRKALSQSALERINDVHAMFMRELTGNATIEERDTWKTKEEAARALIAGNATEGQTAMIVLEAQGDGTDPADLAAIIVAKAEGYQQLIGMAAGLKNKAKAAVAQATDPAVPLDQVEAALGQVFTQITTETSAAIAAWKEGGQQNG